MIPDKLFVFDLDFTLWDAGGTWCDHLRPPFRTSHGMVLDSYGNHIRLYADVPDILQHCQKHNYTLALASRTFEPEWARELLDMLHVRHYFNFEEIFPSSKIRHFKNLQNATGLKFDDMLFFDDEMRNIEEVRRLGVHTVFVRDGLGWEDFRTGLRLVGIEA
jgi:magnesium-dependent phosphatase 1